MILNDKTILITGGDSGVGRALVEMLAPMCRHMLVITGNTTNIDTMTDNHNNISGFQCDITCQSELERMYNEIIRSYPTLSVVINNATIQNTPVLLNGDVNYRGIESEIATNLTAPIFLCTMAVKNMLKLNKPAAFVNISSELALYPKRTSAVYCASKAGLHNFSCSFRKQLEGSNVSVYEAILPLVDTSMTSGSGHGTISAHKAAAVIVEGVQSGRNEVFVGKARLMPYVSWFSPRLMAAIMKSA